MIALTHAFSLTREPFAQDIPVDDLFPLPGLKAFFDRFDYALHLGAATVITGEVGSGKSTSLRAAASRLHPSQYKVISLVVTTGSALELLRQICLELGAWPLSNSMAKLMKTIRELLGNITAKKQIPLLIFDEAHLMRLDILAQLHTLTQLPFDQRSLVPLVLSGQNILIDRLLYYTSKPFASRVVGRTHLQGLKQADMKAYVLHHLHIAGADNEELFAEEAFTAIHQGSGGLLRRANNLARGAMLAAASEQAPVVTAEHVRLASTEIL
jgi:type II secretory pathway predicted ATPase ExeA